MATVPSRGHGAVSSELGPRLWRPPLHSTRATAEEPAINEAEKVGWPFVIFCVYTFILVARPPNYYPVLGPLRLALVFTVLTLLATVFRQGGIRLRDLPRPETTLYLMMFVGMCIGIPFSIYRRRSFDMLILGYIVNVVYYVLFVAHVNTPAKYKRVLTVLMFAALFVSLNEIALSQVKAGRYLRFEGIPNYDPNDVAFVTLSLVPYVLTVLMGSFSTLARVTALASAFVATFLMLETGSRGGFVGLLAGFALLMALRLPWFGKMRKLAILLVVPVMAVFALDRSTVDRYMTITHLQDDYNISDDFGRLNIWEHGMDVFFDRPLTGAGADNFGEAVGTMRGEEGEVPKWQAPHNSYVQMLAETGLLGTVPFVFLLVVTLKNLNRLRLRGLSPAFSAIGVLPGLLMIGMTCQLVAAFFLSQAYSMFLTLSFAAAASLRAAAAASEPSRGHQG